MATGACGGFSLRHSLDSFRVTKLISARNASQSLDRIALEDTCELLEGERSRVNRSLQGFDLGSTFQTAVEVLVHETSEVEEEESRILSEIATETRRLEKLELEVFPPSAPQPPTIVAKARHTDPGGKVTIGTTEGDRW